MGKFMINHDKPLEWGSLFSDKATNPGKNMWQLEYVFGWNQFEPLNVLRCDEFEQPNRRIWLIWRLALNNTTSGSVWIYMDLIWFKYNQQNHVFAPHLSNIRSRCRRMEKKRAFWTLLNNGFGRLKQRRYPIPLQDPEKACWCSAQYIGLIHLNTY